MWVKRESERESGRERSTRHKETERVRDEKGNK